MKTRKAVSLKPNPGGQRLGEEPGHQVDLLDVAVVDLLDLLAPRRVVGQLVEGLHRLLAEQPPELVVAGHAALAIADDVHRRQVEPLAVVAGQVLQRARVVVQRDRAGMAGAERVEQVGHRDAARRCPACAGPTTSVSERVSSTRPVASERKSNVVRHQRMHAVDGDEFFGQRVRRRVMGGLRSDDAAEQLLVVEEHQQVLQILAGQARPVHAASPSGSPGAAGSPASTRPCGSWPSAPR